MRVPNLELRIAHRLVFWALWGWKPVGNMQRLLEAEVLPHFCTFPRVKMGQRLGTLGPLMHRKVNAR